jgi:HNH endonuclease
MAGSMALALAEASSPEFDRAVGFTIDRPEPAPVDPAIEANFARHDFNLAFRRVKFGLAKQWRCDITICDEAIQSAITHLFETDRDLFTKPPDEWMTLLFVVAGRCLGRSLKRKGRVSSIDGLWKENGEGALMGARPAVPASIEGMDEDARLTPLPEMGGRWERLEMLGAAQRFRDANGRPPTKEECKTEWRRLELPPARQIAKEFGSYNAFLLEAGMMPRFVATKRPRDVFDAARACASWRWRHGLWPGSADIEDPESGLPTKQTCERLFGGWHEIDIQLGVEALLTPDELAFRRRRPDR